MGVISKGGIKMEFLDEPRVFAHYHLDLNGMCTKWILFSFSFIMSFCGMILLGLGVYLATTASSYEVWFGGKTLSISYTLIFMGVSMTIVGFMGCCGATNESTPLLLAFFICLFLLLLLQTGLAITINVFQEEIENQITTSAQEKFALYGEPNSLTTATEPIDFVQQELECCGLSKGPLDWSDKRYYRYATYWIKTRSSDVPDSCCEKLNVYINCGKGNAVKDPAEGTVYTQGCQAALIDFFKGNVNWLGALTIGLVVVQLVGLCGSFYLRRFLLQTPISY